MKIQEKLKELLDSNDGKVYVYISKDKHNLDHVKSFMNENVDFSKTTTKGILLYPIGIGKIKGEVDGVYLDKDSTTNKFVEDNITMKSNSFIQTVDPENQEVNE